MMVVNSLVNYKTSSTDVAKKLEELVLANFSDKEFNEWLAHFINARGGFYVSTKKRVGTRGQLVITVESEYEHYLMFLLQRFKAGSILKQRLKIIRHRYSVGDHSVLREILTRIKGRIFDPKKVSSFIKVCELCKVSYLPYNGIPYISLNKLLVTFEGGSCVRVKMLDFPDLYVQKARTLKTLDLPETYFQKAKELACFKFTGDDFNQWLAGMIDGDGCFGNRESHPRLVLGQQLMDVHCLIFIKEVLGYGNVVENHYTDKEKTRHFVYNVVSNAGIRDLVNRVNGHIRNSIRVEQFQQVCMFLKIPFIPAAELNKENAWFSGFFDSDGCITGVIRKRTGNFEMSIRVTNKFAVNLNMFEIFGGKVWTDRTCFEWKIANRLEIEGMLKYFARYPSRSHKVQRLAVIPRLYELKEKRAYKASSPDHTEWLDLLAAWKRWE